MLGVVIGANVGGILGALLAAPVIASAREIIRYLYAKILGENPYPPREEQPETVKKRSWQEQVKSLWDQIQQGIANRRRLSPPPQEEQAEASPEK
jgi:hypothetical protein